MIKIVSFQMAEFIEIKRFKREYAGKPLFATSVELFYTSDNNKYVHILNYGVVVFAGYDDLNMNEFLLIVDAYCKNPLHEKLREELILNENAEKEVFGFNEISICHFDTHVLRIIMLNVGQSVALDYYQQTAVDLLDKTNQLTRQLEHEGRIRISGKNLLKFIGRTLNVKNSITDNLYIFDSHDATWENEYLAQIDSGLKETFDLKLRFRDLDEQLKIIKENLDLFIELLNTRRSTKLEWIIIVLILFEVFNMLIEKLF